MRGLFLKKGKNTSPPQIYWLNNNDYVLKGKV